MNTVLEENIYLDNRVEYLESLLSKISSSKVVVTDRLHAVIFVQLQILRALLWITYQENFRNILLAEEQYAYSFLRTFGDAGSMSGKGAA